jgi:hypothetical protein
MLFKIILVFLLAVGALAMLGSTVVKFLRGPDAAPRVSLAKCAHCSRSVKGTAPCTCGKG